MTDQDWMRLAMQQAAQAGALGEVPVGAVLVRDQQLLATGFNQTIQLPDPTAHAEMVVLRQAAQQQDNYRLLDCTLYVTLEPCCMCAGAMIHARLQRVVFGAYDEKTGAAGSRFDILRDLRHNHQIDCIGGVLAEECAEQLRAFFRERRQQRKAHRHE